MNKKTLRKVLTFTLLAILLTACAGPTATAVSIQPNMTPVPTSFTPPTPTVEVPTETPAPLVEVASDAIDTGLMLFKWAQKIPGCDYIKGITIQKGMEEDRYISQIKAVDTVILTIGSDSYALNINTLAAGEEYNNRLDTGDEVVIYECPSGFPPDSVLQYIGRQWRLQDPVDPANRTAWLNGEDIFLPGE